MEELKVLVGFIGNIINKGTDATSYSWFVWDKGSDKQTIKVI